MLNKKLSAIIAMLFFVSIASIANATPMLQLQTSGSRLIGAKNVDVNGTYYDVTFLDGSCVSLFSGCDNAAQDFAFTDELEALYAGIALLDQVFLDGPLGMFDTKFKPFGNTAGCFDTFLCEIWIPYGLYTAFDGKHASVVEVINTQTTNGDYLVGANVFITENTSSYGFATYALFQKSIPEPDVLGLLAAGAVAGVLIRRRQHRAS